MHLEQTPEEMVPRTRTNMAYKKRKWLLKSTSGAKKAKVNAYKEAAAAGVNLDVDNGMWGKHDDEAWVFGSFQGQCAPQLPPSDIAWNGRGVNC